MDMEKPAAELERLGAMVGSWIGEETTHATPWGPGGSTATAKVEARYACDGWAVLVDYRQERDGEVTYLGHGVFGYHVPSGRYLQHWSDSMSGIPAEPVAGEWEGDTLTFHGKGPGGHVRYVYVFTGPDSYEFRMEGSRDGREWSRWMEARYRRAHRPA